MSPGSWAEASGWNVWVASLSLQLRERHCLLGSHNVTQKQLTGGSFLSKLVVGPQSVKTDAETNDILFKLHHQSIVWTNLLMQGFFFIVASFYTVGALLGLQTRSRDIWNYVLGLNMFCMKDDCLINCLINLFNLTLVLFAPRFHMPQRAVLKFQFKSKINSW